MIKLLNFQKIRLIGVVCLVFICLPNTSRAKSEPTTAEHAILSMAKYCSVEGGKINIEVVHSKLKADGFKENLKGSATFWIDDQNGLLFGTDVKVTEIGTNTSCFVFFKNRGESSDFISKLIEKYFKDSYERGSPALLWQSKKFGITTSLIVNHKESNLAILTHSVLEFE